VREESLFYHQIVRLFFAADTISGSGLTDILEIDALGDVAAAGFAAGRAAYMSVYCCLDSL
jgi:hypothetical protein